MPYIKQECRGVLRPDTGQIADNEGELNYQISCLLDDYMIRHGVSYNRMGDCTSACENAAAEFRRRIMGPYEDQKIAENGDVYTWLPISPGPKVACDNCRGRGTIGIPITHPTNPNFDGWDTRICPVCKGTR